MTIEEIKQRYELPEVVQQEGFEINRAGFIPCIFHEERTASMKIYPRSYYAFCCGKHGDVVDFVRHVRGLSFQDACVYLSGEKAGPEHWRQAAVAKIKRRDREKRAAERRTKLRAVNESISFWRRSMELAWEFFEPMSDEWCDAWGRASRYYNYFCYLQEELLKEMEHDSR